MLRRVPRRITHQNENTSGDLPEYLMLGLLLLIMIFATACDSQKATSLPGIKAVSGSTSEAIGLNDNGVNSHDEVDSHDGNVESAWITIVEPLPCDYQSVPTNFEMASPLPATPLKLQTTEVTATSVEPNCSVDPDYTGDGFFMIYNRYGELIDIANKVRRPTSIHHDVRINATSTANDITDGGQHQYLLVYATHVRVEYDPYGVPTYDASHARPQTLLVFQESEATHAGLDMHHFQANWPANQSLRLQLPSMLTRSVYVQEMVIEHFYRDRLQENRQVANPAAPMEALTVLAKSRRLQLNPDFPEQTSNQRFNGRAFIANERMQIFRDRLPLEFVGDNMNVNVFQTYAGHSTGWAFQATIDDLFACHSGVEISAGIHSAIQEFEWNTPGFCAMGAAQPTLR